MLNLRTNSYKLFALTRSVFRDRLNKSEKFFLYSGRLNEPEDVYLVDPIPVPVCEIAEVKRAL